MLKLDSISLTIGTGTPLERKLFSGLNLEMSPSEFVVIIGENGAGKSTLFNLISGAQKPNSGRILIDKIDMTHKNQIAFSAVVSSVMQDPRVGTMENLTLFENLAFADSRTKRRGLALWSQSKRHTLYQDKLSLLNMGLENRLDDSVSSLSGGERQALSLIMSLMQPSKLLLLDEITAALNPKTAKKIMNLAYQLARAEKRSCLMITHNMKEAQQYADRLLILKDGVLVETN